MVNIMSVIITKPISGIKIEGREYDLRPHEKMSGTYEAPTDMRVEVKIEDVPVNKDERKVLKGRPLSGRLWMEKEERTSTKHSRHVPDEAESNYRRARIQQVRDFVKDRKKEIAEKVERAKKQRAEVRKRKESNKTKGQTYQIVGGCNEGQRHEEAEEVVEEGAKASDEDAEGHVRGVLEDHQAKRKRITQKSTLINNSKENEF